MWYYNNKVVKEVSDLPNYENLNGFVYKITNMVTGQIYIGKKSFLHKKKTRISKTEKAKTQTRKVFKVVHKDSGWMNYYGSSKVLSADVKLLGKDKFKREILELCCTKKYLSYAEFAWQVKLDVLRTDSYNGNILSRWFEKDMQNCK